MLEFPASHLVEFKKGKLLFYRANSDDTYSLISGVYDVNITTSIEFSMPEYYLRERSSGTVQFRVKIGDTFYPEFGYFSFPLDNENGLILRFFDPMGDSKGPGWYRVEESTSYSYSMVDIREFVVKDIGRKLFFSIKLGKIVEDLKNVFVDLYIDINGAFRKGAMKFFPGRNAFCDSFSYWEIAFEFKNGIGKFYRYEFEDIKEVGSIDFKIVGNRINFEIDKDVLGSKNYENWKYILITGFLDEEGNVYKVGENTPNIFDYLTESYILQKRTLSKYLRKIGVSLKGVKR